jgi:hypothetical protein
LRQDAQQFINLVQVTDNHNDQRASETSDQDTQWDVLAHVCSPVRASADDLPV